MAKKDALTGKGALIGNSRSHALNATKRKWDLNLHKVKFTDENNHTHKIKVSARTLKTLRKQEK